MNATSGRVTGFVDPLKYAARLWEASRHQRNGAMATGNGNIGPSLVPSVKSLDLPSPVAEAQQHIFFCRNSPGEGLNHVLGRPNAVAYSLLT